MGMAIRVGLMSAPNQVSKPTCNRPLLVMDGVDAAGPYSWSVWLTGGAGLLANGVMEGEVPIGILIDRLEEYPYEAGGEGTRLPECVLFLRHEHPDGF